MDNDVERLPLMVTELGQAEEKEVFLENPCGKEIRVYTKISNPTNYHVLPDTIIIPAYDFAVAKIRFVPS